MRQAYHDISLLREPEASDPFGMSLGFDFCGEHQFGVAGIEALCGIKGNTAGVSRRKLRATADQLQGSIIFQDWPRATKKQRPETRLVVKRAVAAIFPELSVRDHSRSPLPSDFSWAKRDYRMVTSWGSNGFAIRAFGDEERETLHAVHKAFATRDIAIGLGGAKPFGGSPLNLSIISRMTKALKDSIRDADLEHERLVLAARETGIEAD